MDSFMKTRHYRVILAVFYSLLIIGGTYVLFKYLLVLLAPFILAYLFSCLIEPLVRFMNIKLKLARTLASVIALIISFSVLATLGYLLVNRAIYELRGIAIALPQLFEMVEEAIFGLGQNATDFLTGLGMSLAITNYIGDALYSYINGLSASIPSSFSAWNIAKGVSSAVPQFFVFIFAFLIASFFFSSDRKKINKFVLSLLPDSYKKTAVNIRVHFITTLLNYMKAILILLCITFVELLIGLTILRVDYVLVIAFVVAIVDAIPILGTGTVLIPWAIISFMSGNYYFAVGMLVLYVIILLMRQVLEPKVIGSSIGLHPLLTLIAIYTGFKLIGFVGMFAGPICLIMVKFFWDDAKEKKSEKEIAV